MRRLQSVVQQALGQWDWSTSAAARKKPPADPCAYACRKTPSRPGDPGRTIDNDACDNCHIINGVTTSYSFIRPTLFTVPRYATRPLALTAKGCLAQGGRLEEAGCTGTGLAKRCNYNCITTTQGRNGPITTTQQVEGSYAQG